LSLVVHYRLLFGRMRRFQLAKHRAAGGERVRGGGQEVTPPLGEKSIPRAPPGGGRVEREVHLSPESLGKM